MEAYTYAEIIVSNRQFDNAFSYRIPVQLKGVLQIGNRVLVPFGKGNKNIEGYVIGFSNSVDYDDDKIKNISGLLDTHPLFDEGMLKLAWWMKEKYYTTLHNCLDAMIPIVVTPRAARIGRIFLKEGNETPIEPTRQQRAVIDLLKERYDNGSIKPVLIHGVTGSGKTEVYMQIVSHVLASGKQAIVLVPEISLTPQTIGRFIARFGEKAAVTHSRMSQGERFKQWKRALDGEISIMIGPRSAVFAPFKRLGVIIIDEEQENSYKSETTPKYNVKEVAEKRCEIQKSLLILGSATPSVHTYYEARAGKLEFTEITERVNNMMPEVCVIDMRLELAEANLSIFGRALRENISQSLEKKEQIILFLNRRGHSTFVSCRKCGYVMGCGQCNVNYTYHIHNERLICHYCGENVKNPDNCPGCGSKYIKYFGIGTQKLEDEVIKAFPEARLLRMDMDTTSKKNSHEKIISQFAKGGADILIGTQMIAKGLDFPNVSTVGIMAADMSLNQGDFRSAETTYQLITQVSGRAGRAGVKGNVFIQTYNPEHYSIMYAKDNNYKEFYEHEIIIRRQMVYPPYSHIFNILFICESEKRLIVILNKLLTIMKSYNRKGQFEMLGPAPAIVSKIKNKYRWKLLVKSVNEEKLRNFVIYCIDKLKSMEGVADITMNLTMNPSKLD